MIDFKGSQHPKDVILYAVFFYVRYAVSYRDLEEIMEERGVEVDHATLNRWVVKYSPMIASQAQRQKSKTGSSWRMPSHAFTMRCQVTNETYIKVKGQWTYYYRAVDKNGKTLDFMLSEQRDAKAARRFFKQTIDANGVPDKVVIDKSGANLAGLLWTNVMLKFANGSKLIKILQVKYLNNIVEQDHRFIKKLTRPLMGFKSFHSASATLQGIEIAHMIHKRQFGTNGQSAFQQFAAFAG
jgi:putative transposase